MTEKKPVLLIADDDPEILTLLSLRLARKGYEVVEAVDGLQALRLVRDRKPDLVILDVMMPGRNGWEVAREIRTDDSLKHTGILILTAIGERVNEMTSPLYGADAYIDKPFDFADLETQLRTVLEKRRNQA